MFSDVRQILWIRIRHTKASLSRVMYIAGTDLSLNNISERLYQIYVLIAVAIAFSLLWIAFLDFVVDYYFMLSAQMIDIVALLFVVLCLVFLILLISTSLKSSIIKLSHPDIAYIAASPLRIPATVLVDIVQEIILFTIIGFVVGYVFGIVFAGGVTSSSIAWSAALLTALYFACCRAVSSLLGVARLLMSHRKRILFSIIVGVVLVASVVALYVLILSIAAQSTFLTAILVMVERHIPFATALTVIMLLGTIIATFLSASINRTVVISENALYAELYPLRHLQMYNANSYRELKRRIILSFRKPLFKLEQSSGISIYIKRALISHVRQYESLLGILICGFTIVPSGLFILLNAFQMEVFIIWALMLISFPGGQRDLTKVFRDDQRNRMLRSALPLDTLPLLVLDSLPALMLSSLASVIAVLLLPFGDNLIYAILLSLIFNAALVVCGGLDSVQMKSVDWRFSFELSILVFSGVLAYFVSINALSLLVFVAAGMLVYFGNLLRTGRE